jgi:hypothetical protein
MPTPKLSQEKRRAVLHLRSKGYSSRDIAKKAGVGLGTVNNVVNGILETHPVASNKKTGEFNWREWSQWIKQGQELKSKASWSQDHVTIKLGDGDRPVIIAGFSDQHVGAWGADYEKLREFTDELLTTPNLYIALLGDYCEFAIKMRSVLETTSQVIPPDMQVEFIESWLDEIAPKVAFSTWDNHAVEREEKQSGVSSIKRVFSKKVVYFNGIGHADIQTGKEVYKFAATHAFKQGRSAMNPVAGQMRYMRFEGQDREIAISGDTHKPGVAVYRDGPTLRAAINAGTLHLNSGYAKRYFSLFTCPDYPCIALWPNEHRFSTFWSVKDAREALGLTEKGRRL